MTKLWKNTGVEYEITYPPPPEPPPPAPDPEVPSPPGDGVETEDSPHGDEPVDRSPSITLLNCTTADGYPGVRLYVNSVPQSDCMRTHSEGVY